jgi:replicative DNA helicase
MKRYLDSEIAQLRVPTHSVEAESSVLGALLLDNGAWDRVGDLLVDTDFYRAEHKLIYAAVGALINATKPADVITVYEHLQNKGKADEVGGLSYLNSLAQYVPSAANIRRYAEIIAERAMMRAMAKAAETVGELALQAGLTVAERVDKAQAVVQSLQVGAGRVMPTAIDGSVVSLLARIQAAQDGVSPPCLPSLFAGLDQRMGGGFKGGKQVIIAARPSIGKSSLAEQICLNLALNGYPTAFFSQEMGKDELTDRAIANLGRIGLDRVISGNLHENEWPRLTEAIEKVRNLPLYLDDQPSLTLHDISAKVRMLKRQHDIKLVVIDYIQLCDGGRAKDNRHHQIEELSRGTKKLSKQLDICIVLLSQLNRDVEKRTNGRPVLSDLKESGSIEEDADVVMLLSRGQVSADGVQTILCDIPKNRQGRVGSVTLSFDGQYQSWRESTIPFEFKQPARGQYGADL